MVIISRLSNNPYKLLSNKIDGEMILEDYLQNSYFSLAQERGIVIERNSLPISTNNNCKSFCLSGKSKKKHKKIAPIVSKSMSKTISKSSFIPESEYFQVVQSPKIPPKIVNEGLCIVLEGDTISSATQVSKHEQINQVDSFLDAYKHQMKGTCPNQSPICTVSYEEYLQSTNAEAPVSISERETKPVQSIKIRKINSVRKTSHLSQTLPQESGSHCIYCIMNRLQTLPPCCLERAINTFINQSLPDCSVKSACFKHSQI